MRKTLKLWDREKPWYKNLFADWRDPLFLLIIILLVSVYLHDTQTCREVIKDPCAYCQHTWTLPAYDTAPMNLSIMGVEDEEAQGALV